MAFRTCIVFTQLVAVSILQSLYLGCNFHANLHNYSSITRSHSVQLKAWTILSFSKLFSRQSVEIAFQLGQRNINELIQTFRQSSA